MPFLVVVYFIVLHQDPCATICSPWWIFSVVSKSIWCQAQQTPVNFRDTLLR